MLSLQIVQLEFFGIEIRDFTCQVNEAKKGVRLKSVQLHFIHRVAQYVRRGWKAKRNNFGRPNETISNEIDFFLN